MTLSLLILFVAAIVSGWLGYKYALANKEIERLLAIANHQKKMIHIIERIAEDEEKFLKQIKKIQETTDEKELTDIYNDIIS